MREYFLEFSKYGIAIGMAIYAFEAFLTLRLPMGLARTGIYLSQKLITLSLVVVSFSDLYFVSRNVNYLYFCSFLILFLLLIWIMTRTLYEKMDAFLINNMSLFLGLGLCFISRFSFAQGVRQYIMALVGVVIALILPYLLQNLKLWGKFTWLFGLLGISLLSTVLLLGEITLGAKISFQIGSLAFQPTEFIKIIYVLFLAGALWDNPSFKRVLLTTTLAGGHVLLLVLSKDLGSALIFFVTFLLILLAATRNYWFLLIGTVGGCALAWLSYQLFYHVRVRVLAWRDPWDYIDAQGYQITQSLFAISNGGLFGAGLLQGNPQAIPYAEMDFIFSAICEELGILVGICLMLICLSSFVFLMKLSLKTKSGYFKLIAFGLGVMYIFQIFLTIGGGIKFIPLTGLTLPFLSYGGSSLIATIFVFYLAEGITLPRPQAPPAERKPASQTATGELSVGKKRKSLMFPYAKKEILLTTVFFSVLFTGLIIYLGVLAVRDNPEQMINNDYNSRQQILASRNYRGTIYAAGGEILAETTIQADQSEKRSYPYGDLFAHAVGYATKGKTGVEALANYYLINTHTTLSNKAANDAAGRKNPGDNVTTTLDVNLQQVASREMGIYKGAILVTEVSTGKILAMVSQPDFDPNEIDQIWDEVINDKDSSVLLNRVTNGLYPPGSTFKIVTALEYLRENHNYYENYQYRCNGFYEIGDSKISCYHHTAHGTVDFMTSFAKSCNCSFANIGMQLDRASFQQTLQELYFNQKLPTNLPTAKSSVDINPETTDAQMVQQVIGQGTDQMTPIHLHLLTSAIASGGLLREPYILEKVTNDAGRIIKSFEPKEAGQIMSLEEAQILSMLMKEVVEDGTGSSLSGRPYTAAGKTGSAEYSANKGESHAWFTGFAPAEDPKVCVTVILEGAGNGGDYAAPVARRIMDAYFQEYPVASSP
jgi:peptidoglycan glycosyltransferase